MTAPVRISRARWRLVVGFATLPFLNALVAFLAFPLVWWLGDHGSARPVDQTQAAGAFAILAGFLGLLVTVAGAIPVALTLMRRGQVSLRFFLLAGLLLGNAPFVVIVVGLVLPLTVVHLIVGTLSQHLSPVTDLLAGTFRALLIGSSLGAMSAAVFWCVAVRNNVRMATFE